MLMDVRVCYCFVCRRIFRGGPQLRPLQVSNDQRHRAKDRRVRAYIPYTSFTLVITCVLCFCSDEEALRCPLCGATHALTDGSVRKPAPTGMIQVGINA
jgi:hypothetical protein